MRIRGDDISPWLACVFWRSACIGEGPFVFFYLIDIGELREILTAAGQRRDKCNLGGRYITALGTWRSYIGADFTATRAEGQSKLPLNV